MFGLFKKLSSGKVKYFNNDCHIQQSKVILFRVIEMKKKEFTVLYVCGNLSSDIVHCLIWI